jgi:hypothetical protein
MRNTDANKLLKAGFRFIRADLHSLTIKVQSRGEYSHGWKNLEKGFKTKKDVIDRLNKLLEDEKTIEM